MFLCHGLINYIDTKAKCRHLKNLPAKGLCALRQMHGRRNFKNTNPLMSSLMVILLGVVKQFCRFWIWSETECKTPSEYGPQYISTPPPPPQSHTVCTVYTVHWERGEGEGDQREGSVEGQQYTLKYSSFFHGGNSSQAGSKIQTMSECVSSL